MKSLKKWIRPLLFAVQAVSVIGFVASLFGKKKSYAGVFAATGALAAAATFLLNRKEKAEKKAEDEWTRENYFDGLFDEEELFEAPDSRDADISLSVEEELASVTEETDDVLTDDLSQALKNLEEAGKELEEALGEIEDIKE